MQDIDNTQDVLDSRDIIERIEELEEELEALNEEIGEAQEALNEFSGELEDGEAIDDSEKGRELADTFAGARMALHEWNEDNAEELATLKAFAKELEGYGDWEHGETLIRESYFTEYCEEMLKDCGDLPQEIPSYIVIDWEATADNLKADYTESDFDGVTYYMRA